MRLRKPDWLKVKLPGGEGYRQIKRLIEQEGLHTVCQEALCPNVADCWGRGTATLMILGDICTRSCGFCAVHTGRPYFYDEQEPVRVAQAVESLGLKHVVITSVDRDDLPDEGAHIWAETIRQIHDRVPGCTVEVLIPDFKGKKDALEEVFKARPEILGHNLETVPQLYRRVRPQANYERSLEVLSLARAAGLLVKSGIMVGLGETREQVLLTMADARKAGCELFTIGQYLQPTKDNLPVERYVTPAEFSFYREQGLKMGFKGVESAPLVRSSYHAEEQVKLTDPE